MKKLVVVVVLVLAGLVAYNYFTTGKFTLIPSFSLSEEERELKSLEDEFKAARRQFAQSGRAAALGGVDTTADAEAALRDVERVQRALRDLKKRLTSDSARRAAERLERSIQEFKKDLK